MGKLLPVLLSMVVITWAIQVTFGVPGATLTPTWAQCIVNGIGALCLISRIWRAEYDKA